MVLWFGKDTTSALWPSFPLFSGLALAVGCQMIFSVSLKLPADVCK